MSGNLADSVLFRPVRVGPLSLRNRIAMAPMTRGFSPSGVPGEGVAEYYARRARSGVGLIFTEGTYIAHRSAGASTQYPRLESEETVTAWTRVVNEVHGAGCKIAAQLWHIGLAPSAREQQDRSVRLLGPSGIEGKAAQVVDIPMSQREIDAVIEAYGLSAALAKRAGFDGVEVHAAHGYLIDQFFWSRTNQRTDHYGGDLVARTRFAADVIQEIRARVGPDFFVSFRYSQWKIADYAVRLAETPQELESFLAPIAQAGVTAFHCSQRRFWEPEFEHSDLNLAGWTRKLTGIPTISVGSVTLDEGDANAVPLTPAQSLERAVGMMERGEFDVLAVGRAMLANPDWLEIVRRGALSELKPFSAEARATLY